MRSFHVNFYSGKKGIGLEGVKALARSLIFMRKLEKLSLNFHSAEGIGQEGAKEISHSITLMSEVT